MSIATYTDSPYIGAEGKVLLADRAYVGDVDTGAPGSRQDGATPDGWTDQGSIDGSLVTTEKADSDIQDYTTGLFEVLQDQVAKKDGAMTAKYNIVEYDPDAWAGFTGDVVINRVTGHSIFVGGRPLLQKAVLFIGQNPNTKSEFHHWNPKSNMTWKVVDLNRFRAIEVTCHFLKFTSEDDVAGLLRDFELYRFPVTGS